VTRNPLPIATRLAAIVLLHGLASAQGETGVGRPPSAAGDAAVTAARDQLAANEREHGADGAPTADAAQSLARLLFGRREFEEAEALALRAVRIRDQASPDGDAALADALVIAGACRANTRRHADAVACYERCFQLRDRLLGAANQHTLLALQNLASSRLLSGDTEGGLRSLRELIERLETHHRGHKAVAIMQRDWVTVCEELGRYEEALPMAERMLATARATDPPAPDAVLKARFLVGHLQCRMLRFDEGLAHLDAVLEALDGSGLPTDERLLFRGMRALHALHAGRAEEAAGRETFLAIRAAPEQPRTASILSPLAMAFGTGEEALAASRAAVDACRRLLGPEHPNTAAALTNLAYCALLAGDPALAREHAAAALTVFDRQPGVLTPDLFKARVAMAVSELKADRPAAGIALLQQNLEALPRLLRSCLPMLSDHERMDFAAGARVSLDLHLEAGRAGRVPAIDGWQAVLAWKGTVARGLWQEMRWLRDHGDREGQNLQAELQRLAAAVGASSAAGTLDLAAFERRRRAVADRLDELERAQRPPAASALAAALGADEAFVDYIAYETWSGEVTTGRCCAFVVTRGSVQRVELGEAAPLQDAVAAHLRLDARRTRPAGSAAAAADAAARRLTELVWDPVAALVGERTRVTLCLDGALAVLPFATLRTADGRYLVETREFRYVSAGAELANAPPPPAEPRLCLVGDVSYGGAGPPLAQRDGQPEFAPLPESRRELDAIAAAFRASFGADARVTALTGPAPTVPAFRAAVPGASFVHVATHGFHRGTLEQAEYAARRRLGIGAAALALPKSLAGERGAPERLGGIAFAGANLPGAGGEDGVLTVDELAWLDLRGCELVTVSACESGLGTPSAGDSLVGIRRALRLAGARRSVTTAWKVDDKATAELMAAFYRELWQERRSPAAALRAAQLAMLARNRAAAGDGMPGTWGAFLLEGP
jgi:CHAT domain-containing protein/tetratricopeptide (TPR) repeat protein